MAENTRMGREPIEIVTLHQDLCSREYSRGACEATLFENLISDTDIRNWDVSAILSVITGQIDGDGGSNGFRLTGSGTAVQLSPEISTAREYLYYRIDIRKAGSFSDVVQLQFGAGNRPVIIDVNFADMSYQVIRSEEWAQISVDEVDNLFYRFTIRIELEGGPVSPTGMAFASPIAAPMDIYVSFPIGSTSPITKFVETFGQPRYVTGQQACFNTRESCQFPSAYDLGEPLRLKFSSQQGGQPSDGYYIPSLRSARSTPGRLNPGGGNKNAKALGERSSLTVTLVDHPHDDRLVDPYRDTRDYNPLERGTFWTKWRARNPYWLNRKLEHVSGYLVDGQVVDAVTRTFFITDFAGPDSSGKVSIKAKDVLSQTDASKAQAPRASNGRLTSDLAEGATTFDLDGSETEYPTSGVVRINKELMGYTRSGTTMTVTRAQFNTEADDHDAGDVVQWCLPFQSEDPDVIAATLLTDYAGVESQYLDTLQWAQEVSDYIPRRYSTLITEPVAVSELLSELEETAQFMLWWDERAALVRMRAVRDPSGEEVVELNDDRHLLEDSVVWRDLPDQLVTQVWVYYGQINPAEKLDETTNYRVVEKTVSLETESLYGQQRIRKIFTRWIPATGGGNAIDLGNIIARRYSRVPREAQFSLDAKDRELWLADYIRIINRNRVDIYGQQLPVNMQVLEAQESEAGTVFSYTANEYQSVGPAPDPNEKIVSVASDFANINLYDFYIRDNPPPEGGEVITFYIRNGATIGGYSVGSINQEPPFTGDDDIYYSGGVSYIDSTQSYFETINFGDIPILQRQGITSPRTTARGATYNNLDLGDTGAADVEVREYPVSTAITTGDWPEGVTLRLVIEPGARVIGEGGNGSCHATTDLVDQVVFLQSDLRFYRGVPGGDGGHCFDIAYPIEIDNQGIIAAGGGGGGTARFVHIFGSAVRGNISSHGGGGAGYAISDVKNCLENGEYTVRRQPSIGDFLAGGAGGIVRYSADDLALGGAGGAPAADGGVGSGEMSDFGRTVCAGGKPGKAVVAGGSLITWVSQGDLTGEIVS